MRSFSCGFFIVISMKITRDGGIYQFQFQGFWPRYGPSQNHLWWANSTALTVQFFHFHKYSTSVYDSLGINCKNNFIDRPKWIFTYIFLRYTLNFFYEQNYWRTRILVGVTHLWDNKGLHVLTNCRAYT